MDTKLLTEKLTASITSLDDENGVDVDTVKKTLNEALTHITGDTEIQSLKDEISSLKDANTKLSPVLDHLKNTAKGKAALVYADQTEKLQNFTAKIDNEAATVDEIIQLGTEIEEKFKEEWSPKQGTTDLTNQKPFNPSIYKSGN